ncbi:MAG: glutaredoxin family protein [Chloroflexota bacterium]|nr:glutaredoxin family protein [Chloroflexota bacterium]
MTQQSDSLVVYGADWCHVTQEALAFLDDFGVDYEYVNIEQDPDAAAWVREQNGGMEVKPTLKLGNDVLTAPRADVLEEALRQHRMLA